MQELEQAGGLTGEAGAIQFQDPDNHAGNLPALINRAKWTALGELASELLKEEHWSFKRNHDGPQICMNVRSIQDLPDSIVSKLKPFCEQFGLSDEVAMQVMVDLIATNHLGTTSISEYCRRFQVVQDKWGAILYEAIYSGSTQEPDLDQQLGQVYHFLEELASLASPEDSCIPFYWQFSRQSLFIFLFDYGGHATLPLGEYLAFQLRTAQIQTRLFGDSHPSHKAGLEQPRWQVEAGFEGAYAEENAAALSVLSLEKNTPLAALHFMELQYPFPHYALTVLSVEDSTLDFHTFTLHFSREHREAVGAQQDVLRFFVRCAEKLGRENGCNAIRIRPDGLQMHIHDPVEFSAGLTFEGVRPVLQEHSDWEDPFLLRTAQDLEKRWPDTARLRRKAAKWLKDRYDFQNGPPRWVGELPGISTPYQLEVVPGYLESKKGLALSIVAEESLDYISRKYRLEAGFTCYLESGVPTVAIQNLQVKKDHPDITSAHINGMLNHLKRLYRSDPFALLTAAIVDWAHIEKIPRVVFLRGSENLWLKYHQNEVDPDIRTDRVAASLCFDPPGEEEKAWTLSEMDSQVASLPAVPEESRAVLRKALQGMLPQRRIFFPDL